MAIRRFGDILAPPCARPTFPAATAARSSPCSFRRPPPRSALGVADRVRRTVEREPFNKDGRAFRVTVSAGVADTEGLSSEDRAELLVRADKALYYAKDTGRNRSRLFSAKVLARRC